MEPHIKEGGEEVGRERERPDQLRIYEGHKTKRRRRDGGPLTGRILIITIDKLWNSRTVLRKSKSANPR